MLVALLALVSAGIFATHILDAFRTGPHAVDFGPLRFDQQTLQEVPAAKLGAAPRFLRTEAETSPRCSADREYLGRCRNRRFRQRCRGRAVCGRDSAGNFQSGFGPTSRASDAVSHP